MRRSISGRFLRRFGVIAALGAAAATGDASAQALPEPAPVTDRMPPTVTSTAFPLTVRSIMRGPEIVGWSPEQVRWSDDSRYVFFRWRPAGSAWNESRELYRVRASGGEPERLGDQAADSLAVWFAGGDMSADRAYRVSAVRGDLYLVKRRDVSIRRLTETEAEERDPTFSADGTRVRFTRDGNLFSLDLSEGRLRQLTDIRHGPRPKDEAAESAEGQKGFLEKQQRELFEHIRIEKRREEERRAERKRRERRRPAPLYLSEECRVMALAPDPTGRFAVLTVAKKAAADRPTAVPEWVTESGYTDELTSRTKVGDEQEETALGRIEIATGRTIWPRFTPRDSVESPGDTVGPYRPPCVSAPKPDSGRSRTEKPSDPGARSGRGPGESPSASGVPAAEPAGALARVEFLGWNDAGTLGLVFAVDFDYKEWRLYAMEASTGHLTLLDRLRDDAWVGGPCFARCMGWIPGEDRVYYVSEASGYAHLYTVAADGSDRRQLTSGEWEVLDVSVTEDRRGFWLHTSETSPFDQHAYTLRFDGSRRTAVTRGPGRFRVTPSPDGKRLAIVHSTADRPPELFLSAYRSGLSESDLTQVTVSPTPKWLGFRWIRPEIVKVPASDGSSVPARIYRPADLGAEPNGAGILFVHGAGYLHNVHRWWSSYYREYMFHHLLAASGYTVLDVDYRGSAGYGRDWRTAIYRHMGGKDLDDQVAGARYLASHEGIDPDRIGIYGGSYGGFLTLMAMFTQPDVFQAGAALRSVTDWAHYNHWYTSRILNLPQNDPEAYERSSPIYFADGFRGHLLIAHGMVDTNVHFSDVVRLAQRLIELGKENWEMAVYPVESHGFIEPASWADEYRRIFELFERTIGPSAECGPAGGNR
ncbi:MAG: prolyl oligopeptidase family serine peptidase [Gemmatimonadota bacterium]